MNRRKFLHYSIAGSAGLSVFQHLSAFRNTGSTQMKLGIILSTLKQELRNNPDEVFKTLSELGYSYIEGVGRYDIPAEVSMKYIKKYSLKPVASGNSLYPLVQDIQPTLDLVTAHNMDYLVCYWPWMDSAKNITYDQCIETSNHLNQVGKKCQQNGVQFAWHNHDKEFQDIGGKTPFEIIMENTDPEWVKSELDVYWVKKAGRDPLRIIKEYPGRIGLLHLKDILNDEEGSKTCPGNGIIDFKPFLEWKKETKIDYLIVENEGNKQGLACARESYDYLTSL